MRTTITMLAAVLALFLLERGWSAPGAPGEGRASGVLLAADVAAATTDAAPRAAEDPHPSPLPKKGEGAGARFAAIDVFIDPKGQPLAAYQFEFTAADAAMQVVGVENGEHPAFREAPYYDRDAVQQHRAERIIVGAFNTAPAQDLPSARTRVTRIHVQITGPAQPRFVAKLTVAASTDGRRIPAEITLNQGVQP